MIYITPRQAELLSYLTGRGPVGEWVSAPRREVMADLGMSSSAIAHKLAALFQAKLIERDVWGVYRVLRRLEDGGIAIATPPRPLPARRKHDPMRRIRYVGYDPRETAIC